MIVLNGEPFVKYCLQGVYDFAHEIIIVEGAVENARHLASPEGRSVDGTVETILNFPDPENKIKLIQKKGFWKEKDEQANAYMEVCTGDYIWQLDADEFYRRDDIKRIFQLLSTKEIQAVSFKMYSFWGGFNAYAVGGRMEEHVRRIHKYEPGYRYLTHRPPTVLNFQGQSLNDLNALSADQTAQMGIFLYHYSYVFPDQVKTKVTYYSKMWKYLEGLEWYEKCWLKLGNPLMTHPDKRFASWLELFNGEHPDVIQQLIFDLNQRKEPFDKLSIRDESDIFELLNSPEYPRIIQKGKVQNRTFQAYNSGIRGYYIQSLKYLIAAIRLDKSNVLTWLNLLTFPRFVFLTILRMGKNLIRKLLLRWSKGDAK